MQLTIADYVQILGVIISLTVAAGAWFKVSSEREHIKAQTSRIFDELVNNALERERKLKADITGLEAKVDQQNALIESLKSDNAAKNAELKDLRKLTMSQSDQITTLQNEIAALRLKRK